MFEKGRADWSIELPSVTKQYNNAIHSSTKMTPVQASKKTNEKLVYSNLQDKRRKLDPKDNLSQLVRTADKKEFLVKKTVQTIVIYYIQLLKSYMIPSLAIELTIYPRDKMKTFYYLQNYLWNKTIKL